MEELPSLYKINEEYKNLVTELEYQLMTQGEASPEISQAIEIRRDQLIQKCSNYNYILTLLESQIKMAEAKIAEVQAFKSRKEAVIKKLDTALLQAVLSFGDESKTGTRSLEIGTSRISTRKSTYVQITEEEKVPDEYKKVKVEMTKAQYDAVVNALPAIKECKIEISVVKKEIKTNVPGAEVKERINLNRPKL